MTVTNAVRWARGQLGLAQAVYYRNPSVSYGMINRRKDYKHVHARLARKTISAYYHNGGFLGLHQDKSNTGEAF